MIFEEKKLKTIYKYRVKDVFGVMEITSKEQLNAEKLDEVFVAIFTIAKKHNSETIKGDVQGTNITYKFKKSNPWKMAKKKSKQSTD